MRLINAAALLVLAGGGAAALAAAPRNPRLAGPQASIGAFAFVEGVWLSETRGRVFEEIWSGPAAGVMTGMGRGHQGGQVGLLEWILVEERAGAVLMKVWQTHPDSTSQARPPIVLRLVESGANEVLFRNEDHDAPVRTVRYWSPSRSELRTEVALIDHGAPVTFTVRFRRGSL